MRKRDKSAHPTDWKAAIEEALDAELEQIYAPGPYDRHLAEADALGLLGPQGEDLLDRMFHVFLHCAVCRACDSFVARVLEAKLTELESLH